MDIVAGVNRLPSGISGIERAKTRRTERTRGARDAKLNSAASVTTLEEDK